MAEDHYSLSAKVFHSIREDILNGKYQANEELKEKNLAGKQKMESGRCVKTPGDGSPIILTDTKIKILT